MTPIFVPRDIFDREGITGRLSGMALGIKTTSLNGCPPDSIVNIPLVILHCRSQNSPFRFLTGRGTTASCGLITDQAQR
ncbi:hypothetical protein I7I51_09058 [Histoplasma capsulatum]|uniref:Uncharacterized protein n=1 Tax=Ajellomyces capsulatus TaxID=5037 RepID=A0A8A1M596_AJECA|nr:hypothetical protein I7I51_09058 [Histoplasma capsulatum]